MADHVFESRVWLARPRPEVFAFFADPTALERLTPPTFRLRWLGLVPLRWRAFVREWDPPFRFVDVQVRGPFARWEHRHRFLEEGGGTWVEDRVTYRLPLGPLGRVAHAGLVRRQLRELWDYRHRQLAELVKPLSAPAG